MKITENYVSFMFGAMQLKLLFKTSWSDLPLTFPGNKPYLVKNLLKMKKRKMSLSFLMVILNNN